jgi:hypothetical protein
VQRLTATNGSNKEERLLLEAPVFQARDSFGNPVPCPGLHVVLHLARACHSKHIEDLPALEPADLTCVTDKNGKVGVPGIMALSMWAFD